MQIPATRYLSEGVTWRSLKSLPCQVLKTNNDKYLRWNLSVKLLAWAIIYTNKTQHRLCEMFWGSCSIKHSCTTSSLGYTLFNKQHFHKFVSNARLKLAKNQTKAKEHPEAELLLFEN